MEVSVKVVDASAAAAVLFGEPRASEVADRLQNSRLVAPTLLGFELANVCLVKLRRSPALRDSLLAGFALLDHLGIDMVSVSDMDVINLAEANGLTAYDGSYLWLARELAAELVTLDSKLALAAARSLGEVK